MLRNRATFPTPGSLTKVREKVRVTIRVRIRLQFGAVSAVYIIKTDAIHTAGRVNS